MTRTSKCPLHVKLCLITIKQSLNNRLKPVFFKSSKRSCLVYFTFSDINVSLHTFDGSDAVIFNGNMERIWMCTCIFRRTGCIYYFGQSWDHNNRVLCAYLCIFVYFLIKLSNTNIKHVLFFIRINPKKEKTIIEQMWCYFIQIYSAMSRLFFFSTW